MEEVLIEKRDYSLVGPNSIKAVQEGLAEANWYVAPVPREKMRELLERRNGPAILDTIIWFGLIFGSGYLIYLFWGSWWVIFPILVYSMLYASTSDSRWHEASHGTAFKSDWMNDCLYEIASFMVFRQSVSWRWSHTRHHSDTIIVGRDPEIASPRPPDILGMILNLFAFKSVPPEFRRWMLHIVGRIDAQEQKYIPKSEYKKLFLVARVWAFIYLSVISLAIYLQSWLPLFYIGFPTFLGSYMIVVYGLTQHAGLAENVLDHRLNCRTVYMNRIHRFLYWNMNYHLEHHMFPLVPYYNLPKLHELIKDYCPKPYQGIIETYKEIIPALLKQAKDPTYYVKRELPPSKEGETTQMASAKCFVSTSSESNNGLIEVCSVTELAPNEVIRFDCDHKTFAIYQTETREYYATDGICTHGSTHLADGLVIGDLIECPKHNGRFQITDGSVQRPPVCTALSTYQIKIKEDKIFLNLHSAGGEGQKENQNITNFRVVSNQNVATYIKELILEPIGNHNFNYQPGDYIQIEIPAYEGAFKHFLIEEPYVKEWKERNLFRLHASNHSQTRRNYSMASNPANNQQLRFNVRIALPPIGLNCSAGVGSSYVYGLQPGDQVNAWGPFGNFHIQDNEREMLYIGGGAGMAPLCSHISYLLETQRSKRKINYWYGARSKQEIFYKQQFADLAQEHDNFNFHIALSEPKKEDHWKSYTGFIHEVVHKEYLLKHPKPNSIDYYLCGPPIMVKACIDMLKNLGVSPEQIAYDEF